MTCITKTFRDLIKHAYYWWSGEAKLCSTFTIQYDVSSIIKWPVVTVISDVHSIVEEPAPPFHKALIIMYNHRWSFCGTVRDYDHALHWLDIKIVMKVILRQGFWSCFTLIWYKICNDIHFAARSGIILPILPTKKQMKLAILRLRQGFRWCFPLILMKKL